MNSINRYNDEKVSKYCSWDHFPSREAVIDFMTDRVMNHPWHKAICLSGRPVGSVSVTPAQGNDKCRAEIGYVVGSPYWGKGVATRAVKMAAEAIFAEWEHLERLQAVVDVENVGSQRVLEKAGFQKEGLLRRYYLLNEGGVRDAFMYSLLSGERLV